MTGDTFGASDVASPLHPKRASSPACVCSCNHQVAGGAAFQMVAPQALPLWEAGDRRSGRCRRPQALGSFASPTTSAGSEVGGLRSRAADERGAAVSDHCPSGLGSEQGDSASALADSRAQAEVVGVDTRLRMQTVTSPDALACPSGGAALRSLLACLQAKSKGETHGLSEARQLFRTQAQGSMPVGLSITCSPRMNRSMNK